jgi:hypothetical protein
VKKYQNQGRALSRRGDTRTKRKRVILYAGGGFVILLFVGLLVPALLPARFVFHESLTIKIRVTDKMAGKPVAGAEVWIRGKDMDISKALGLQGVITDANGMCEFQHGFEATGIVGRSGQFHIGDHSLLVVRAAGFRLWERPLDSLFGRSRDYYQEPRVLSYAVTLEK